MAEIARIAGVAVPTIHVWAARYGWKPRASRLRGEGAAPRDGIADLQAEVAAARRRAEQAAEERKAREEERQLERTAQAFADAARHARRLRAAKRRSGGSAPEPVETEAERAARRRETVEIIERAVKMREGRG